MTKQKWKFFRVHRKDKRRFSEKIMYSTHSHIFVIVIQRKKLVVFFWKKTKKWVECGGGGISHTRKKKGEILKIKGGNVSRRNDVSQRVGFGVCSRKKKKGPRKEADDD